jgi:hypothetical protein
MQTDRTETTDEPANDEMVEGYRDGLDPSSPEPSDNRSCSYQHGFANGRDDRRKQPRDSAAELRRLVSIALETDRAR